MSHSITSRRRTTRRRRRASRIGSPPVRRLPRRVRRRSIAGRGAPLVAAGAPQRGGELEARHQPVELRELVRLERVEALAGERSSSLAIASGTSTSPRRARRRPARRRRRSPGAWPSWASPRGRGRSGGAGRFGSLGPARSGSRGASPKTERKTASKAGVGPVGDEHRARGPVQPAAAVRPHQRQRPREAGRALGGHRHAGLAQALAQRPGERRQVEVDRLDHLAKLSHRCARAARGRPRGSPPGPRRTSAPSRA